jgi:hypothetical protein
MPAPKRITDLVDYTAILPYASELFGVYQTLIGWRSKRQVRRFASGAALDARSVLGALAHRFAGRADPQFNADHQLQECRIRPGTPGSAAPRDLWGSVLFGEIVDELRTRGEPPRGDRWEEIVNEQNLGRLLEGPVCQTYVHDYTRRWREASQQPSFDPASLKGTVNRELREESAVAGLLLTLASSRRYSQLEALFYGSDIAAPPLEELIATLPDTFRDPFLTFDPTKQVKDVTLSPLGIVHLFRQYFFELDTFLGTPVSHLWLSPGTTVELLEVSTRRTLTEKVLETSFERSKKEEHGETNRDELSEAVKQENRSDTKLGFSTSVTQSWGTGSATANASIDLAKTQQVGREQAHKRMREQSTKLSVEIRQSFKSTFKTVAETIDTSSKRYVISNPTGNLINYELRRKMRQVGVQIQDVGTYLCWQTFVDDPGDHLALPNLIHIAKPADLAVVPEFHEINMPADYVDIGFTGEAVWNFPDNDRQHAALHPEVGGRFVPIATHEIVGVPNDYEVVVTPDPFLPISKSVMAAEDDDSWNAANWGFLGMVTPDGKFVRIGVMTGPGGLAWNDRITFKVSGAVRCRLNAAKRLEIKQANDALLKQIKVVELENQRKLEQAYLDAVHERVTLASKVTKRAFEHLREEERTIVYRSLIAMLMTEHLYHKTPDSPSGHQTRHVLSELINAIFDIDKMLYFVAPEWWKPRRVAGQLALGGKTLTESIDGAVVRWADDEAHGRYFITDKSDPAPLGASLGWLLQLDGDDLRNAFLNAPWVKAVIPIRPGKEQAAIQWLKSVGVEGVDGLDATYAAPHSELTKIRDGLLADDAADPVAGHAQVTIDDAIRHLCLEVAAKHRQAVTVAEYPDASDQDDIVAEINDDNRVATTPIEKVFEHGFYPLKGGFKAVGDKPFKVSSQWIEILPTDQVVPVEVEYDPRTGRLRP